MNPERISPVAGESSTAQCYFGLRLAWVLMLTFAPISCALAQGTGTDSGDSAPERAEHHSNGLGGGRWSDSAAWKDGTVPVATDHVIISSADQIVFDAGTRDEPNCAALSIDPEGVLTFRLDGGRHRLIIAGPVESYGAIRLDATHAPESRVELRLAAEQPAQRVIRLLRGSSLLFYGTPAGTEGSVNALLSAVSDANAGEGTIEATGDVMLDLQNTGIAGIHLRATGIDNTGFRPRQRLNIVNNVFRDGARLTLTQCDTPVVTGNRFLSEGEAPAPEPAITLDQCSLAACRDNSIRGYAQGMVALNNLDPAIQNNAIYGANIGITLRGGRNCMLKNNRLFDCSQGLYGDAAAGTVESLQLENTGRGVVLLRSILQLSDVAISNSPENAISLTLNESAVTLLNCNIATNAIQLEGKPPVNPFWVQTMFYLVVRVTGKVPSPAVVQVCTAKASGGVPATAADLNVRNAPARLSENRFTPLPRTQRAIIVQSWQIDLKKELRAAPFYDLTVLPVVNSDQQAPKALFHQVIEPADTWFRADPNALKPTLEVKIP